MKKNINIGSVPTIRVEISQAPVSMADWVKSQGLAVAAAAATTLITGVISGLCARVFQPKPKPRRVDMASTEEIIDEATSMIQDDE